MPKHWQCPRCNYTTDPKRWDTEADIYFAQLKPGMQNLIKKLFRICNRYVYKGRLSKRERSKFLYTIGGTTDLKDVIYGIQMYLNDKMYKKALPLTYLSAIIRNRVQSKQSTIEAERKLRGYDPPGE
tara:strand:- start:290 stop:670 length:381 start_codon:yes stop_codon:yes gene_type:complete